MNNDELQKRIEKLQARINSERHAGAGGAQLRILTIFGGLLPEPIYARAGEMEWLRDPGEEIEPFAERCARAAREAGKSLVIIGELPSTPLQVEAMEIAHAAFMANGYSDVPDVEEPKVRGR